MEVKARITKHKSTRTQQLDLPVAAHFVAEGHSVSQLKFKIIDGIPPKRRGGDRTKLLLKKELFWIFSLDTMTPRGLNLEYKTTGLQ